MRCAIVWCSVMLGLVMLGCRQQATQSTGRDNSESSGTAKPASDRPAVTADTGGSANKQPNGAGEVVNLEVITLTAPIEWQRKPASSSFVAAEFALPHADGDDAEGRLTVSTAGGSVQANIDRWKSQFAPQPSAVSQEDVDVAGLKVTIVDFSGDFKDQRRPFAPGETRPGYRMIAAVIPVGGQLHFVKATGPQKTITLHADAIRQFIRSAKPTK